MSRSYVSISVKAEVKRLVQDYATRLGMTESDVVELAVRILQLIEHVPLGDLKIYVEPKLLKWLYENSIEFRRVLKHICSEIGYVV